MDKLRISYAPREDATPEGELSALAAIYAYVIGCHDEGKKGGTESGRDEGEEEAEHDHAQEVVPGKGKL